MKQSSLGDTMTHHLDDPIVGIIQAKGVQKPRTPV